ncbi:MAG: thioesterase family protein [Rhodospirillaceae bacterium]|nr:thioesterase family protein [Rhodospirillaceae bacterium]
MNLIFRMTWTFLCAWLGLRFGPPVGLLDEARYNFRCLPTDIDFNLHLTNSRYSSFMDIARIAMMIRNGAWGRFRAAGMLPVLGSMAMKFRRGVKPFERFAVTSRTIGWDEKWIYLEHKMMVGEHLAAVAVMKAAFLGSAGRRIATDELIKVIGYDGPVPAPLAVIEASKALNDALKA